MRWVLKDDRGRKLGAWTRRGRRVVVEWARPEWRELLEGVLESHDELYDPVRHETLSGELGANPALFGAMIFGHAAMWGLHLEIEGVPPPPPPSDRIQTIY